jgi:SAM-dependent methyltransferase
MVEPISYMATDFSTPPVPRRVEFDAFAASYDSDVAEATAFARQDPAFYLEVKAAALVALLDQTVGAAQASVVDVGCGSGAFDRFLLPSVRELHGVDVAREMVARAAVVNPSAKYRAYGGGRLPYDDASFDLAFASCVLHHVEVHERSRFVAEMARVVKPGGTVAILEHNPVNPLTRLVVSRCRFDENAVLLRTSESLQLLRSAALASPSCSYIVFFPWRHQLFQRAGRLLVRVPLGAQYVASGRVPREAAELPE